MTGTAHDPLFDSAWFKWAQAIGHAQALESDIEPRNIDPDPDPVRSIRTEYSAKRHGFAVVADDIDPVRLVPACIADAMPARDELELSPYTRRCNGERR